MKRTPPLTALVTGANRGIGFEVGRQLGRHGLDVILTGRDAGSVASAVRELRNDGLQVIGEELDVASEASVVACAARLEQQGQRVDVLVNNAGVYPAGDLLTSPARTITEAMAVNFFGALWTARAWMPEMNRRGYGRVVNVTSGYGSFAEGLGGPAAYAISKAALNALTVRLSQEARGDVKVNAVCPGWVRTRMGGSGAPRTVEEGADTVVWLATLPADGPSGGLFRNRRPIPW
ncbi:SDR family oxidoreductase [Anaeromyxobacter oryzisoli]|uniref:SDR family oxidoreductase n=1 Tax=Anaeromyxobacter oryzisoli TaxID=2925408 RepID=UPI001F58AEA4|nr:SDR family oxidoreductase [Anaeromyxobacter sp. SG63]